MITAPRTIGPKCLRLDRPDNPQKSSAGAINQITSSRHVMANIPASAASHTRPTRRPHQQNATKDVAKAMVRKSVTAMSQRLRLKKPRPIRKKAANRSPVMARPSP